ncbi:FAD-binding oxidoreductase [Deinococcus maricopensis]|uniref:D-lactate dehydrogenase (cytochrome) n=1 Tax=Deinococcus maricopensis (strain DSM 21211 / LMG 22137 / NRRL B-23946 / LB-34) TaxID=709986 RepID=E8UB15_DEIML|nr:FAD-binding oxidoreductase [Deinococcus maricopensis]ADV68254.1 D-lactate dehydrogenase (cytochrome) [Deinococcus maricopensis DSM 21211]
MTNRAPTRPADGAATVTLDTDPIALAGASKDAAHLGSTPFAVARPRTEADLAHLLTLGRPVLAVGAQSSLTGGASASGQIIARMDHFTGLTLHEDGTVTAGAGVPLTDLLAFLHDHGRDYPATPTWLGATVGGVTANNAAGAATFKYGPTRAWVQGLTVVLADGDVLDLQRGQVSADHDSFLIDGPGGARHVPLPAYRTPDLPKIAGGYHARPHMDLVDLFIGAEGTLGIITQVRLRTLPKRATFTLWLPLRDETAALALTGALRDASRATWASGDPNGLDVAAVESLDARCLQLLREDGHTRHVPARAGYALIVQLDVPPASREAYAAALDAAFDDDAPDHPLTRLVHLLLEHDAFDDAQIALPGDPFAADLLRLREAVPEGANRRVGEAGATKVGGDTIVPFDRLPEWLAFVRAGFAEQGLDVLIWGHLSDGNLHPNLLPRGPQDVPVAYELMQAAAHKATELGGAPLSEHGVGKHKVKQALLRAFYGDAAIDDMRAIKRALDPRGLLAPGNLFPAQDTPA